MRKTKGKLAQVSPTAPAARAAAIDRDMRAALDSVDRNFDEMVAKHAADIAPLGREPLKIMCQKGCAACCTYNVAITDGEAHILASAVQRMEPGLKAETLRRLAAWARDWRRFAATQPSMMRVDGKGHAELDGEIEMQVSARWSVRRAACPFLDLGDHSCRVYADRPVACRTHHATEVPDDWREIPTLNDPMAPTDDAPPRPGGEGCFTTPEDVERGGCAPIWQLDNIGPQSIYAAWTTSAKYGMPLTPIPMPIRVLLYLRKRFGITPSDDGEPVPEVSRAVI